MNSIKENLFLLFLITFSLSSDCSMKFGLRAFTSMRMMAMRSPIIGRFASRTYNPAANIFKRMKTSGAFSNLRSQKKWPNFKSFANASNVINAGVIGGFGYCYAKELQESIKPKKRYVCRFEKQRDAYYEKLLSLPWGKVAAEYIKDLEDQERKLMEEFYELAGISEATFKKALIAFEPLVAMDNKAYQIEHLLIHFNAKVPEEFSKRAQEILHEFGLSGQVKVLQNFWKSGYAMAANVNTIYLSPDYYGNEYSSYSEKDAVFRHEIMHILHQDSSIDAMMRIFLARTLINSSSKINEFLIRYSRFFEGRADKLSMLASLDVAYGRQKRCERFSDDYDDNIHPSGAERKKYSQLLLAKMMACVEQQGNVMPDEESVIFSGC